MLTRVRYSSKFSGFLPRIRLWDSFECKAAVQIRKRTRTVLCEVPEVRNGARRRLLHKSLLQCLISYMYVTKHKGYNITF